MHEFDIWFATGRIKCTVWRIVREVKFTEAFQVVRSDPSKTTHRLSVPARNIQNTVGECQ